MQLPAISHHPPNVHAVGIDEDLAAEEASASLSASPKNFGCMSRGCLIGVQPRYSYPCRAKRKCEIFSYRPEEYTFIFTDNRSRNIRDLPRPYPQIPHRRELQPQLDGIKMFLPPTHRRPLRKPRETKFDGDQ